MNCNHDLNILSTNNKYVFFACLLCLKAEPITFENEFICDCGNKGTKCWTFSQQHNCIYCKDCKKIIKS
jgi:hypothetical protein